MAIIKCKMCGGDLNLTEDSSTAQCEYCGSVQTVPKVDDEKKLTLFARANRLRVACEFDKSAGIYETILADFPDEAEAYWGLVLCKYGIEYVDDPATNKKIPTCHRSSFESVLKDSDYDQALENADVRARRIYREEANAIEELRKSIIAVSANEDPYDIFICYKETDENGNRTEDSAIAQHIYNLLTEKGYRVFFSRITLEDKLGVEFEPYIFAALNSAKIMLLIGTDYDYFDAVWVKNEWSRFLKLMAKNKEKHLFPCYKGIQVQNLPEALSRLQALDLNNWGYEHDLLRGIEKILPLKTATETVIVQSAAPGVNTAPLLKRAFLFLEDGDWRSADEYCEKVLDQSPECGEAYLGKLLAELHVKKQDLLQHQPQPFAQSNNYQKVLRFGDEQTKKTVQAANDYIVNRNENNRLESIYTQAMNLMAENTEQSCKEASRLFATIPQYEDAAVLKTTCLERAEEIRLEGIYTRAMDALNLYTEQSCQEAAKLFGTIPNYKDSAAQKTSCLEIAESLRLERIYSQATAFSQQGTAQAYRNAAQLFGTILNYRDSVQLKATCLEKAETAAKQELLAQAKRLIEKSTIKGYEEAIEKLEKIPGWQDADSLCQHCRERIAALEAAQAEFVRKERERIAAQAAEAAELARRKEESAKKAALRKKLLTGVGITAVVALVAFLIVLFAVIIPNSKYDEAIALMDEGKYTEAVAVFETIPNHKDSGAKILECYYCIAEELESDSPAQAAMAYGKAIGYQDAKERSFALWEQVVHRDTFTFCSGANICLQTDGTVVSNKDHFDFSGWKDIVAICAGSNHIVGLKADGTVVAVGAYDDMDACQVGDWTDIVDIAVGYNCTVGLKADGTIVGAGISTKNMSEWTDIVDLCEGPVGLKADGTVVGAGEAKNWTDITAIAAYGQSFTVGLKSDGTVITTSNNFDDVPNWTNVVAIAAAEDRITALCADGTVLTENWFAGGNDSLGWSNVVAIGTHDKFSVMGFTANGSILLTGSYDEDFIRSADLKQPS